MEWWDSILDVVSDVSDTAGGIYNDWTTNTGNSTSTQKPNANDTGNTYPQVVQPAVIPVWAYGMGGLLLVLVIVLALKGGK
ncbi:hypothetical protein [Vibrio sp. VB16]|uniref:hypothetical protein n=1 Tax=Vibrio sp. VB16 TaxID=2785746 RepID=UPI00189F238D|nr:hypothetical protein [Vibrio sp. VB16]UGA55294.1 hypothetical protein IUZ65_002780 [Vibrio sp. VB16]